MTTELSAKPISELWRVFQLEFESAAHFASAITIAKAYGGKIQPGSTAQTYNPYGIRVEFMVPLDTAADFHQATVGLRLKVRNVYSVTQWVPKTV